MRLQQEFRENGVVYIENALDPKSMAMAEEAYQWSLAHPSPGSANFVTRDSAATFYQDLANPQALAPYRKLLEESPAADISAKLWGTSNVWFMYEQVFLKEGGESRRTPWHQDSSYLPIDGDDIAVMWISFEPVAKENSLEFVRGSHRGVLYDGSRFDPEDDTAPLYGNGVLPRLPDIEADRAKFDIVSWAVSLATSWSFIPRCCTAARRLTAAFGGARSRCASSAITRCTSCAQPTSRRPRLRFGATLARKTRAMPSRKLVRLSSRAIYFGIPNF